MDGWPENEVRKISRVWQDPEDRQWWLVVFDLANLRGRIECVGVAVRSSLGPLFDVEHPVPDSEPESDLESLLWNWIDPIPMMRDATVSLRPLRAAALRRLPLVEELKLARHDYAGDLRLYAENLREHPVPWATPEDFEEAAVRYTRGKERAPRIKTTHKLLEHVADIYQRAWREGEVPPSTAVRQELQVTSDQARKLVVKCRKASPPLLPPTERRKARGWLPGEREDTPMNPKDPPARERSTRQPDRKG